MDNNHCIHVQCHDIQFVVHVQCHGIVRTICIPVDLQCRVTVASIGKLYKRAQGRPAPVTNGPARRGNPPTARHPHPRARGRAYHSKCPPCVGERKLSSKFRVVRVTQPFAAVTFVAFVTFQAAAGTLAKSYRYHRRWHRIGPRCTKQDANSVTPMLFIHWQPPGPDPPKAVRARRVKHQHGPVWKVRMWSGASLGSKSAGTSLTCIEHVLFPASDLTFHTAVVPQDRPIKR